MASFHQIVTISQHLYNSNAADRRYASLPNAIINKLLSFPSNCHNTVMELHTNVLFHQHFLKTVNAILSLNQVTVFTPQ
jgi:hypothetical protein